MNSRAALPTTIDVARGALGARALQEFNIDREFAATRRVSGLLVCPKYKFFRGSAPDSAGGAYSAPPDSLAGEVGTRQPPQHPPLLSASNFGHSGL